MRGRDQRVGHSYFMETKLEELRTLRNYPNDSSGKARAVAAVLRDQIVPLLAEYFHEDWREIVVCMGVWNRRFGQQERPLLSMLELSVSV